MTEKVLAPASLKDSVDRWFALFAIVLMCLILNIDGTAVNVSLVPVAKEMHAQLGVLQWIMSGYGLSWSICVVISGKLSDIFGPRIMLLIGAFFFMVFSIWCALSQDVVFLISGRFLQGVCAAISLPPLYGIIYEKFSPGHRGFAIGLLGMGSGVGTAVGPTVGGIILEYLDWHWIYYINVPLCIIVGLVLIFTIKKDKFIKKHQKIDFLSSFYLAALIGCSIYGINNIQAWGFGDYRLWVLFGCAVLAFILLRLHGRDDTNPIIPKGSFSNKLYVTCLMGYAIIEYIFGAVVVIMGIYLQSIAGYSALITGMLFLSFALVLAVCSPLSGKLSNMVDPRIPTLIGLLVCAIGIIMCLFLGIHTSVWYFLLALAFVGGMGLTIGPYNDNMLKTASPQAVNTLSGLYNMGAGIGFSLGIVVSTSLLVGVAKWELPSVLKKLDLRLSQKSTDILDGMLGSAHRDYAKLETISEGSREVLIQALDQSFMSGFRGSLYLILGFAVIAAVITLLGMKIPKKIEKSGVT